MSKKTLIEVWSQESALNIWSSGCENGSSGRYRNCWKMR